MREFIIALGLFLVLEGVLYGLFPAMMKKLASELLGVSDETLRVIGCVSAALGVIVVWVVKG